jgi:hypothetical protein
MNWSVPRWALALAIPVVATLAFWLVLPPAYRVAESSDYEAFYRPVAEQIRAGHGIVLPNGAPALRYPPGYPVIIAATIGVSEALKITETAALDILTLLCVAASSLLLHLMAREAYDGWLDLLPSAAWSTYPLALWFTKQPNSELPFTILLFGSVYLVWLLTRRGTAHFGLAAAAGALCGAAMLLRPIAILLPVVFAVVVWLLGIDWPRGARALAAAAIIGASVLVVAPWEIHAGRAAGRFVLLSTSGVPAMRDGLTFGVNMNKSYRQGIYVPDAVRTVMIRFYVQYDSLTSFGAIARAGGKELTEHPVGVAGLVGMKLVRAWYGTDSQRMERYILLIQAVYLALLGWAAWMAWWKGGEKRRLAIIVLAVVATFWAMSVLALPLVRYMVPAIGLLFVLLPSVFGPRDCARAAH